MARYKNRNGVILWRGPSEINGEPIVVIATGLRKKSKNRKTKRMIQVWILCANTDPYEAALSGKDRAICGKCIHRGRRKPGASRPSRVCYLGWYALMKYIRGIWECYKRGNYPTAWTSETFRDLKIRLGAYGDPGAVPMSVWFELLMFAKALTAYTHQWRTADPRLKQIAMASPDTRAEATEAAAAGWRYFRVTNSPGYLPLETGCPASAEANHASDCERCGACDGHFTGRTGHKVIQTHGTLAHNFKGD